MIACKLPMRVCSIVGLFRTGLYYGVQCSNRNLIGDLQVGANHQLIECACGVKYLQITFDSNLNFDAHCKVLCGIVDRCSGAFAKQRAGTPSSHGFDTPTVFIRQS